MRALRLCTLAAAMLGVAFAADELVWKSLFAPPYDQNAPSIMVSLACLSRDLCFVPGGENGVGFGMYSFDGQTNGNFTQMNELDPTLMILSVAAGGSPKKPNAAFGGIGLGNLSKGLQYLAPNGTEWLPSQMPKEFLWQTQSMAASPSGTHIISFGQGAVNTWIMHSRDSGRTFQREAIGIAPIQPNCTWPQYATLVDENTWFVTFGGYTGEHQNNNQNKATLKRLSPNIILERDLRTGQVQPRLHRHRPQRVVEVDQYMCDYTGQIGVTNDGGKTWENLFSTWEYTITQIDCISKTHCVTVGWGVTEADVQFTVILTTTNGRYWRETLRLMNTTVSFNDVEFADAQEVWVAGADTVSQYESAGVFYVSKDGGETWAPYKNMVPNLIGIMDMSFTPDGSVGFAAAISLFQTSTILRYEKQSFSGYFTQENCPLAGCSEYCQNVTFPQGMCLESQGGSAIATCNEDEVVQKVYNTTSCVGPFTLQPMPLNKCINGSNGFFVNFCNTSGFGKNPRGHDRMSTFLA